MATTPGTLIVSQTSTGATSLPSVDAGVLDGKFIRLVIAGISGGTSVKLYINSTQILVMSASVGGTFVNEVVLTWNSTNQDVTPQTWIAGTPTNLTSFNPSSFTFGTDAVHTVTSLAAFIL